ncbi:hypothetical protein B0A48_03038 [Cryoendolithus antarcticus]|uniref:HIT-type domain-containing protein n=1 Tax=Cryoendolithus antarcticus TaxID=1507870 RepID=A0A1V8TM05_9PEZI|nr:hypothetical protein B0A48_03038 [Cryoendolithus antarcticus]
MALRFRTPHIEELPTAQTKQAPGFAWVTVPSAVEKPAADLSNKKRGTRFAAQGQTDAQKEAHSVRQQEKINARIRELNSDNARAGGVVVPKKEDGSAAGKGKTPNTRKILSSMKHFSHYLDDEVAEFGLTGKVDGMDRLTEGGLLPAASVAGAAQRASKTPLARRLQQDQSTGGSPRPATPSAVPPAATPTDDQGEVIDGNAPFPSQAEIDALLNAPPLLYSAARSAAPPVSAPPPRVFCEICGYWGRVRCLKCGARTCSVDCETIHVADRCLKFYA